MTVGHCQSVKCFTTLLKQKFHLVSSFISCFTSSIFLFCDSISTRSQGKRWKTAEQTGTSYLFTIIWQSEISLARIGLTLRQLVKLGACDWLNVKSRIKIFKGENRNQKMEK